MTNIDRRKCQRVVPLRILYLGISRTGTKSLRQALFDPGYSDVYHYTSLLAENPRDVDMWIEAFRGKYENGKPFEKADWDQLLGHCEVILTVLDSAEAWYRTYNNSVHQLFYYKYLDSSLSARIYRWLLPSEHHDELTRMFLNYTSAGEFPGNGTDWYESHNAMIKAAVPLKNLFVHNVKEGWNPLCGFFVRPVPVEPFPRVNDAVEFETGIHTWRSIDITR